MGRKIEIELTSRRDDGTWTWRAPGAREPRGDVDGALVPEDAKVGDVLRAEADFDVEGIVVTAVNAPRNDGRRSSDLHRIEILGSGRSAPSGVSVSLAGGRRPRDEDDREDRRPRREARSDGRPARRRRPDDGERPAPRREAGAERRGRPGRDERDRGRDRERSGDRPVPTGDRPGRRAPASADGAERGRQRRLQPAATFRNATLAELRPEQLPVAEQLLRGGIPAVRQAIDDQNSRASSEGRPTVSAEPLLTMAEELLPRLTLATWKDRATAVRSAGKEAPLREVRSVVSGASAVALDDEARALHSALREGLDTRVTTLRDTWQARINSALDEGRVADALRIASRPPEPAARIPAEMAVRLSGAAGAAMSPEVPAEQWLALLDVVVGSPIRRTVKPAGLPADADDDLLHTVRRHAGQVPELARLLGLPIPPPPGPRRPNPVGARRG